MIFSNYKLIHNFLEIPTGCQAYMQALSGPYYAKLFKSGKVIDLVASDNTGTYNGIHIVEIDKLTGNIVSQKCFDTENSVADVTAMISYIDNDLITDNFVLIATSGPVGANLNLAAYTAL